MIHTSWGQRCSEQSHRSKFCCSWGAIQFLLHFWWVASSNQRLAGILSFYLAFFRSLVLWPYLWSDVWRSNQLLLVFSKIPKNTIKQFRIILASNLTTDDRDDEHNVDCAWSVNDLKNECWLGSYLDTFESIRLESLDLIRDLLDNLALVQRLHCHYFIFNTLTP